MARYNDSCCANTGTDFGSGQLPGEAAVLLREVHDENCESSPDGVHIAGDGRAGPGDLGGLIAAGSVDDSGVVVHGDGGTEVDELELFVALHHVVGLEVAVGQAFVMQIAQRRRDLDDVGDRLVGWQRSLVRLADLLERCAADVLHDDVADRRAFRILVLDEVVDPDDVGVFHLGEGEGFGGSGGHRVGVARVHETLEHHPAVVDVAVDGQVDPAESAVGDAAAHFVLPADQVAARKLGNKGERCAALGAEPLCPTGFPVASTPDGLIAVGVATEPVALRNLRIGQDRLGRIAPWHRWDCHHPGAESSTGACGFRRSGSRRSARTRGRRHGRRRRQHTLSRRGRRPADVAVAVDDGSAAVGFEARHRDVSCFPASSCW